MKNFLYAGIGQPLESVSGATGESARTKTGSNVIASASRSESIAAHDCRELVFAISFESAPGAGNIIIEKAATQDAAAWDTHATIAATGKTFFSWAANERLLGFYRVFNSGTSVNCSVKVNKFLI